MAFSPISSFFLFSIERKSNESAIVLTHSVVDCQKKRKRKRKKYGSGFAWPKKNFFMKRLSFLTVLLYEQCQTSFHHFLLAHLYDYKCVSYTVRRFECQQANVKKTFFFSNQDTHIYIYYTVEEVCRLYVSNGLLWVVFCGVCNQSQYLA